MVLDPGEHTQAASAAMPAMGLRAPASPPELSRASKAVHLLQGNQQNVSAQDMCRKAEPLSFAVALFKQVLHHEVMLFLVSPEAGSRKCEQMFCCAQLLLTGSLYIVTRTRP